MATHHCTHHQMDDGTFDRDIEGLDPATPTTIVDLADGATFDLAAAPVRKQIGEAEVRMLAYNGSVPGPTLRVPQDSEIAVRFTNHGDTVNTVHWHGLRLDNRFDGTHETQIPVPVGGAFEARVSFPDPGVYWYHPHIREDYGQELGLYGNVLVVPTEADYWPPVHREELVMLDDLLLEHGKIASFDRATTTHSAMGRFGNVLLAYGTPDLRLAARQGEVVRFYLTNSANTRVFNVAVRGARMKLVGGDSGRVEHEAFVETVMIAPSERVVVDVRFDTPGEAILEHRPPHGAMPLATIAVSDERAEALAQPYEVLRHAPELAAERDRLAPFLAAAPDKTLAFVAEMNLGDAGEDTMYVCPMHPEVVSEGPASCPKCGMKLLPASLVGQAGHGHRDHGHGQNEHAHHDHGDHQAHDHGEHAHHGHGGQAMHGHHVHGQHEVHAHDHHAGNHDHQHHAPAATDGIEWDDDMVEVNRMTTPANTRWIIVDRTTGAENHAIDWRFRVGDRVKIRLVNEMASDHPMHHPFHIHGAGRFLVLARDGNAEPNLVWKDTVLVRTGERVDILLEVTNPGLWMAHCHIAEHHESGMMFSFHVDA